MRFYRYVALGDSFSEGVGDPDTSCRNGWRGWSDRVAEALAAANPTLMYANFAVRGRRIAAIIEDQLPLALELEPDLVSINGGANDLMRARVDLDQLASEIADAVAQLRAAGVTVVLQTIGDPGNHSAFRLVRGRIAILNEHVRRIGHTRGAVVVDNWRLPECQDYRYWAEDRLHLGPAGHQTVAINTLDALGFTHELLPLPVPELQRLTGRERRRANRAWVIHHLIPWAHRWITGRSTGDGVVPKWPELAAVVTPRQLIAGPPADASAT